MGTRRGGGIDGETGQVVGAGHRVVHVRAAQQLPGFVVDAVFQQRLADALRQAAVDLAFDDHGVHDVAEIVHGNELLDVDDAGFRIDLHFADMRPGRIGEVRRIVEGFFREPRLQVWRIVGRDVGGERHLAKGKRLIGVRDFETAFVEGHLILAGFQHVGGDLLALGDDLVGRRHDSRTAHRQRTRAVGAERVVRATGVAVQYRDVLERYAQLVGDDLREGGFVALAVTVGAGNHGDRAGNVHAHFAHLEQPHASAKGECHLRRREAARFDVAGKADAALLALLFRSRLAGPKAGVVGVRQRFVQAGFVISNVVSECHRRFVGKVARLNEVAAADVGGIHVQFPRRRFHQAFDNVGGLGAASASVGVHRRGVGEEREHFHVDGRGLVLAGQERAVQIRGHAGSEGGEVGTHVGAGLHAQAEELAVFRQRQFGVGDVIASVGICQEGFRTLGTPLDRPAQLAGGPNDGGFLRVDENLGAETAADIRRDDPQFGFRCEIHERRQHQAFQVRILRGGVQRVGASGGIVLAQRRSRFDGVRNEAIVDDVQAHGAGCLLERLVGGSFVAKFPVVALVVGSGLVDLIGGVGVG